MWRQIFLNARDKLLQHDYQETFRSLLWAIIVALIVRTLVFEPFSIPSSSMYPGLKVGDYLITTKYTYGYSRHSLPFSPPVFSGRVWGSTPNRGDVVIFKGARDPQQFYIKRVIGLPGDIVQLKQGVVHVNHKALKRNQAEHIEMHIDGGYRAFDLYLEEAQNNKQYQVIQEMNTDVTVFPNSTYEYLVPPGYLFLLGDNRNNSADSRFEQHMGMIPLENVVSKVRFIAWPGDFSLAALMHGDRGRIFRTVE